MNKILPFLVAVLLGGVSLASAADQVLSGTYQWDNGGDGPLEATFVETAPETWEVKFVFRFQGRKNTWKGTASGKLGEGTLEGRVKAGRMNRIWVFSGEFEDGIYRGTHAELVDEDEVATGTLVLSMEP